MKISHVNVEDVEEIKPISKESEDRAIVKFPTNPNDNPKIPDDIKEIIAVDAIDVGVREAARIHGVSKSAAHRAIEGSDALTASVNDKFDIGNVATAKLMQTLGLLNPHDIEKEKDKIVVIDGLSRVIERINGKDRDKGGKTVHLHLYAPNQKKETDYGEVIEVS